METGKQQEEYRPMKDKSKMSDAEWAQLRELFELEISRKQLAELFEISAPRLSQLERDGHLTAQPNGMFNFREAIVEYGFYLQNRSVGGRPLGS
jgi:hypothetical protein